MEEIREKVMEVVRESKGKGNGKVRERVKGYGNYLC